MDEPRNARRSGPELRGRHRECVQLDQLVQGARAGQSRVLVMRGEAGVGKTALLDYLVTNAVNCRIARAAGVESEMELAFAGLHQLCAPMLDRLESLPGPQADALGTAFGLSAGEAPDRFLVGLRNPMRRDYRHVLQAVVRKPIGNGAAGRLGFHRLPELRVVLEEQHRGERGGEVVNFGRRVLEPARVGEQVPE